MSQNSPSNNDLENVLTFVVIFFVAPIGAIGAWLSGLAESVKNWLLSLGIFLPTIPTAEGNPEAGDVTEAASTTHTVFSIPELGIALDTP